MASDRHFLVQPLALRTHIRKQVFAHNQRASRPLASHSKISAKVREAGTPPRLPCFIWRETKPEAPRMRPSGTDTMLLFAARAASIVTFGARRPHWREVVLSSSCASERVRRSPQCGGSRDCQSPLQWRRVLPCLVKLPEQGVCVGLLLPPLGAAHAEMQQLGAVWGCWMWCTRRLAV